MLRRSRPEPEWKTRVDRATELIARHSPDPTVARQLRRVPDALTTATQDRVRLEQTIELLDPERISRELKTALRARLDPAAPDDDLITSLRQRHELHHRLQDRLEELDRTIEKTLVDLDTLAARTVELSFASPSTSVLAPDLQRLDHRVAALSAAHEELENL